jgi:hypothetical protein
MKPHFLFPQSPLTHRPMVDEMFQDQALALKTAGFGTSVLDESLEIRGGSIAEDAVLVYRGWMMDAETYSRYIAKLTERKLTALTSAEQYLATHYLPNWYPLIKDLTPNTEIFPLDRPIFAEGLKKASVGIESFVKSMRGLSKLGGIDCKKFQLKDYVKSLKTAGGSVITKPEEIIPALTNMEKYRGVIEGGICVRFWEDFKPGSETRFFILNGKFYAQKSDYDLRVYEILRRLCNLNTPFFSVDIAQRTDGEYRVIEIGDGQVSDLVGWTPTRFAEIWRA